MNQDDSMRECSNRLCQSHRKSWRPWRTKPVLGVELHNQWFCGPDCVEPAAERLYTAALERPVLRRTTAHRVPLGLLLLSKGVITGEDLKAALQAQRESGKGKIGEWLRRLGAATEVQVTAALGMQWGCPVFPLENYPRFVDWAELVPLPVLEATRMIPVHFLPDRTSLYVAFADAVNHPALKALEEMLDCRAEACLVTESALDRAFEELRRAQRLNEIVANGALGPSELAAATRKYLVESGAHRVRTVNCGEYVWTRMDSGAGTKHILFPVAERALAASGTAARH
jgi:hypothetical protein